MVMRALAGVFAVGLVALAVLRRGDGDIVFWAAVLGAGALWCALAAALPRLVAEIEGQILALVSWGAALLGVWAYWPEAAGWWRWPALWESEAARGAVSMIAVALGLALVVAVALRGAAEADGAEEEHA